MLAPPPVSDGTRLRKARLVALVIPAGLLGGALFSQYVGGLYPCEMCWWQRYPHGLAILLALAALASPLRAPRARPLVLLAALAMAVSGAIGVYHAGVELKWWEGFTTCTTSGARTLEDILSTPLVRCDQVQWSFLGLSLAAWNAIISIGGATLVFWLAAWKRAR
ncbi:MAG: disulfide bond formation protein B [Sphingomonas sp.]|uniref:disulfide bond formation protein B n=1 Tax=Sphingomonas sp. TaxID=28214 RepID=UPI00179B09D9|nr:disulfide bond formation protein B [Sphingomonas sp.]MBA3668296.1 disulfide bond formation protein B [Sphingomonas sp.]